MNEVNRSKKSKAVDVAKGDATEESRSTSRAYAEIKAMILDNDLAPGSNILEQSLAKELGLSRTPVREAFVRLQHEGLLEIVPRHGARISTLSLSDMREIYQVLLALEPVAIEILTLRKPGLDELAVLMTACDEMEEALIQDPPDLRRWAQADETFHANMAQLCGNRRLGAMIMTVWEQAHRARMFTLSLRETPHRSTAEHKEVVAAILKGDPDFARKLYEGHRRRGGEELMALIEKHGIQRL